METVQTDENGFFSTLMVLPKIEAKQIVNFQLYGTAYDSYGNKTNQSNIVHVKYDKIDAIKTISATPAFTGITSPEDIDKFLNGELSIDQIRRVILEAVVTKETQQVEMNWIDNQHLPTGRQDLPEGYPGMTQYLLPQVMTNNGVYPGLLSTTDMPLDEQCQEGSGCTWQYSLPIHEGYSGVYEVRFRALKGDTVYGDQQIYSAGFKVDGTLPAAPMILVVDKNRADLPGKDFVKINPIENVYYTNRDHIRLRGAAEPGSQLEITNYELRIGTTTVSPTGIWELEVPLTDLISTGQTEFTFDAIAREFDENDVLLNETPSANEVKVVYDNTAPELESVERTTPVDTIAGWVKTGDPVTYDIEANEKLQYADLIKEDDFVRVLDDMGDHVSFQGTINADRETEGYYKPKIRLQDFAGNITTVTSDQELVASGWEYDPDLGDWRLYIDNTRPEETRIDTSLWGDDVDGIFADFINPELGRLNPEFVISRDHVTIMGLAEKEQRVEFFINNSLHEIINVDSSSCEESLDFDADSLLDSQMLDSEGNIAALDELIVKYSDLCRYTYEYYFPGSGKNNIYGYPQESYVFQVRTLDKAANRSEYTKQEILYDDRTDPFKVWWDRPTNVNDWPDRPITRFLTTDLETYAEQLADIEIWESNKNNYRNPKERTGEYYFFRNGEDGSANTNLKLGSYSDQNNDCMKMVGNRRIGICDDGYYKFVFRATDAAGNNSDTNEFTVERDTVRPIAPSVSIGKAGDIFGEYLKLSINGEGETIAQIKITNSIGQTINRNIYIGGNGNFSTNNLIGKLACENVKYTVTVKLVDRAGNVGDISSPQFITTRECPKCGYGGDGSMAKPLHDDRSYIAYEFGYSQKYFGGKRKHVGVDYNGVYKGQPIYAAAAGYAYYGWDPDGYGHYIKIKHNDNLWTYYGHMVEKPPIVNGTYVTPNDVIGKVGTSGHSTGYHLHFGVMLNGVYVDPRLYLGEEKTNLTPAQFAAYCKVNGTGGSGSSNCLYDGKNSNDLGDVIVDVEINKDGEAKIVNTEVPTPKITKITVEPNKYSTTANYNTFRVHSVAVKKNHPVKLRVKTNCGFWGCDSDIKEVYAKEGVEHSGLAVVETRYLDEEIAWDWFHNNQWDQNGTKGIDIRVPEQGLRDDTDVYVRSKIYGRLEFNVSGEGSFELNLGNNRAESRPSNRKKPNDWDNSCRLNEGGCYSDYGYNRCNASSYTWRYGPVDRNNNRYFYPYADCTNFSSQVLYESGLSWIRGGDLDFLNWRKDSNFWSYSFYTDTHRTYSWAAANNFGEHAKIMSDKGERYEKKNNINELKLGDIIQLVTPEGEPHHSIVVSGIENGEYYIASHTNNYNWKKFSDIYRETKERGEDFYYWHVK